MKELNIEWHGLNRRSAEVFSDISNLNDTAITHDQTDVEEYLKAVHDLFTEFVEQTNETLEQGFEDFQSISSLREDIRTRLNNAKEEFEEAVRDKEVHYYRMNINGIIEKVKSLVDVVFGDYLHSFKKSA